MAVERDPETNMPAMDRAFDFACPRCRAMLEEETSTLLRCPLEGRPYPQIDGIWRFLPPERAAYFEQFMQEYQQVRQAEGRGSEEPAYYQALPFVDLTGHFQEDWRIRAVSFRTLLARVVSRLEEARRWPLKIVDVGAGNGWLSYRLVQRGHQVVAVDLLTNSWDGLGAHVHYPVPFIPVQAEFDFLPFVADQMDLVVFNGSFHYSVCYEATLEEAWRVLGVGGQVVIMDTPVYSNPESGRQMVREREALFEQTYGFPSNALPSENFLTFERLKVLGEELQIDWEIIEPDYGWRWRLRPWKARLRRRREPAKFLLLVGRRR